MMKKLNPTAIIGTLVVGAFVSSLACGAPSKKDKGFPDGGVRPPTATAVSASPTSSPTGPLTSFSDGTFEVGTGVGQVVPGVYKSTVPTTSRNCYWERQKKVGGSFEDIAANGNQGTGTPVIVTIADADKGFKSQGCGTWVKS